MSQSFALCSEGGKFSTTTERSRVCEGEYKKNNSGHNTRKGEDGRECTFINSPFMKFLLSLCILLLSIIAVILSLQ